MVKFRGNKIALKVFSGHLIIFSTSSLTSVLRLLQFSDPQIHGIPNNNVTQPPIPAPWILDSTETRREFNDREVFSLPYKKRCFQLKSQQVFSYFRKEKCFFIQVMFCVSEKFHVLKRHIYELTFNFAYEFIKFSLILVFHVT